MASNSINTKERTVNSNSINTNERTVNSNSINTKEHTVNSNSINTKEHTVNSNSINTKERTVNMALISENPIKLTMLWYVYKTPLLRSKGAISTEYQVTPSLTHHPSPLIPSHSIKRHPSQCVRILSAALLYIQHLALVPDHTDRRCAYNT